jgi:H+-transporting ATPase
VATQVLAALLCGFGLLMPALPWQLIGLVWGYNLAWTVVQDGVKLIVYRELVRRAGGTTAFLARVKRPLHGIHDLVPGR